MFILKAVLLGIHVIISFLLVAVILMQSSKGGGLSGAFGGQGATTMFGPRGSSDMLVKVTQYLAAGFLILSLVLSMMAGGASAPESITQSVFEQSPAANLPSVDDIDFGAGASGEGAIPVDMGGDDASPAGGGEAGE